MMHTQFQIQGAGDEASNGLYAVQPGNGFNGKPMYAKADGRTMWFNAQAGSWVMGQYGSADAYYVAASNSATPPHAGWQPVKGALPAPVVCLPAPGVSQAPGVQSMPRPGVLSPGVLSNVAKAPNAQMLANPNLLLQEADAATREELGISPADGPVYVIPLDENDVACNCCMLSSCVTFLCSPFVCFIPCYCLGKQYASNLRVVATQDGIIAREECLGCCGETHDVGYDHITNIETPCCPCVFGGTLQINTDIWERRYNSKTRGHSMKQKKIELFGVVNNKEVVAALKMLRKGQAPTRQTMTYT